VFFGPGGRVAAAGLAGAVGAAGVVDAELPVDEISADEHDVLLDLDGCRVGWLGVTG
jgi:hypothetical protein